MRAGRGSVPHARDMGVCVAATSAPPLRSNGLVVQL